MSTEPESSRTDKSRDELPSKIAGIPVSEFKAALKELRVSKGADEWATMNARHFTKAMEKSFKLEEGKLKHIDLSLLIDQAEDEHREEEKKEKAKKRREEEKKKKEDEEKEEKEQTSTKKAADPKVAKRRRDNSPERASKKTKRHSHSSEGSDSERKRKSTSKTNKHKKMKRDYDDPTVQKIEKLKKVIRGCGVPITGFHKDMSNDRTLRKLLQIIQEYEKDGMKERMTRPEMLKVRSSIEAQREVDELKRIPKKLQISGKHPRKVTRKKVGPKYDLDLEKASSSASETPSETHSNYSSGAD